MNVSMSFDFAGMFTVPKLNGSGSWVLSAKSPVWVLTAKKKSNDSA